MFSLIISCRPYQNIEIDLSLKFNIEILAIKENRKSSNLYLDCDLRLRHTCRRSYKIMNLNCFVFRKTYHRRDDELALWNSLIPTSYCTMTQYIASLEGEKKYKYLGKNIKRRQLIHLFLIVS